MTLQRYTVLFERGDRPGQWLASIKERPQVHTFGRGLAQTRARIREALVLWEGDGAASAELREVMPLPAAVQNVKEKLEGLRSQLEAMQQECHDAVALLLGKAWSMRDIAEVLGLSHQRVGQVALANGKRRRG